MRRTIVVLTLALAMSVTGCASATTAAPSPREPTEVSSAPPTESSTLALVGLWRVSGVATEARDTWLRLGAGELVLWRPCGMLDGSWLADRGAFLATIDGASQDCAPPDVAWFEIPWLLAASGYAQTSNGWDLTDASGGVVASLTQDGKPQPIDTADPAYAEPPVVDEHVRAFFQEPTAPTSDLVPMTAAALIGPWRPATGTFATKPAATFAADGTWTATDGCNGVRGRWSMPQAGRLLAIGGAQTLIGCDGAPVPDWIGRASFAARDGDGLVLFDRNGAEIASLTRS